MRFLLLYKSTIPKEIDNIPFIDYIQVDKLKIPRKPPEVSPYWLCFDMVDDELTQKYISKHKIRYTLKQSTSKDDLLKINNHSFKCVFKKTCTYETMKHFREDFIQYLCHVSFD